MSEIYLKLAEKAGAKTSLMTNSYKDFLKIYFELIVEHTHEVSGMRDKSENLGSQDKGR